MTDKMSLTWEDMRKKYPEYRDEMTEDRERAFVEDCFACYEGEGFAKKFWSQDDSLKEYVGKPFTVVGRVPEYDDQHTDGVDLECLPMWKIHFEDGKEIDAYPDEIIPSKMRDSDCPSDICM